MTQDSNAMNSGRVTFTFGGIFPNQKEIERMRDERRACVWDSEGQYLTPPRTLARQIECDVLNKAMVRPDEELEEYSRRPDRYIQSLLERNFLMYVATEWCESRSESDWSVEAILATNQNDTLRDWERFFENFGIMDFEYGATLEGIWLMKTVFYRVAFLCLWNGVHLGTRIRHIRYEQKMTRKAIVDFLDTMCLRQHDDVPSLQGYLFTCFGGMAINGTPVLVYDGVDWSGHAIEVIGWHRESDTIVYRDPWPEDSLLCEGNNSLNISAKRFEGIPFYDEHVQLWQIDRDELAKAMFAAFIPVHKEYEKDILHYPGGSMPIPN